jgi:aspartate aminotransferase
MHELYTSNMPDSMAMCKALMDRAGVAMVPGEAFGDDNCLRLSYATDDETLAKALDRVGQVLFKNKSFG